MRERESVCVCVCEREREERECVYVCVREREREIELVLRGEIQRFFHHSNSCFTNFLFRPVKEDPKAYSSTFSLSLDSKIVNFAF